MTEYIVLIPDDETAWDARAEEANAAPCTPSTASSPRLLAERGHKVTAGAELTRSTHGPHRARHARRCSVTEGPYAESVEQLTGFYLVETDDLDDLLQVVGILAEGEGGVEVRACVDHS